MFVKCFLLIVLGLYFSSPPAPPFLCLLWFSLRILYDLIFFPPLKWSEVAQSCPTLCHPMDCSLPGSSVHRIFQVRILEWIVISFCRGSPWPRNGTQVCLHCRQMLYRLSHQGSPRALKYRDLTPYWIYQPSEIILLHFWTTFLIDADKCFVCIQNLPASIKVHL